MGARSVCSATKVNVDCEAVVGARSVCSAPKDNADCEAFPLRGGVFFHAVGVEKGGGLPNGARAKHSLATIKQDGFLCEAPLFPLRGGVFLPISDGQKGGGLPNGARAKHSLATIKQEHPFNFQNAKL